MVKGRPVQLVSVPEVGVPKIGVTKVGEGAIEVTPVLEMVMAPVTATDVGTFELLPTRMFPLVRVASLLNAIAALDATEALTTEPADGVLTPTSEMVKV